MPKRILIIGILFCLGGILAISEVLAALLQSHFNINFAVLMLPIGIGILKGKKSSQWWARFWIILGYIVCILLMGASIAFPENLTANGFGRHIEGSEAIPYVLSGTALFATMIWIVHRALYSNVAQAYFDRKSEAR